jgi:hypothetical protein
MPALMARQAPARAMFLAPILASLYARPMGVELQLPLSPGKLLCALRLTYFA